MTLRDLLLVHKAKLHKGLNVKRPDNVFNVPDRVKVIHAADDNFTVRYDTHTFGTYAFTVEDILADDWELAS